MSNIQHIEWLNENAQRSYPLREDATCLLSKELNLRLPNYVIVDFVAVIPYELIETCRLYIHTVTYVGNILSFIIRDQNQDLVTTITIDLQNHIANKTYTFYGIDKYSAVVGKIVIGDVGVLGSRLKKDIIPGQYECSLLDTEFEPTTIRPSLKFLHSLSVENRGERSPPLYGAVTLIAGENVEFVYDAPTNTVTINVRPIDRLKEDCPCEDGATAIQSINGLSQTISFVGDECLSIEPDAANNVLRFKNICSHPCCGCTELEFVKTQLSIAEASANNLLSYANLLNSRITDLAIAFSINVGA